MEAAGEMGPDFSREKAPATIPEAVERAASLFGGRPAIVDGDVRLSFAELAEEVRSTARSFLAIGVEPGDRVGIWAPNSARWAIAALGAVSAGAVLVPINTRFRGAEAAFVLRRSGTKVLCCMTDFLGTDHLELLRSSGEPLPDLERTIALDGGATGDTLSWDEFLGHGRSIDAEWAASIAAAVRPDDLSEISFTSGTTGQPKGVMYEHGQCLRAFWVFSDVVGLRSEDRYLIVNPFFHSFGYKAGVLACLMRGTMFVPVPVFDVAEVLAAIDRPGITVLPGPPTLFHSILSSSDREHRDLSTLRLCITGAAVIPEQLVERMRSDLGFETVITAYGLTEAGGVVTSVRPSDDLATIARTSGRAIDGVQVRIVDEEGEPVPPGSSGEIVCRGFNVMRGYLDDPSATAEAVDERGWLHTGDVGTMDANGNVTITDRIKDVFQVGGFNVYPAEVEMLIARHPDVTEAAVIGVPDDRMGEVAQAHVVLRPEATTDEDALMAWCRENLANYKAPRTIEVRSALPRNASGKVQRFELRRMSRSTGR